MDATVGDLVICLTIEGNKCPDFMAKLGVSNDVKLSIHSSPPEDLLPLLRTDELGVCFLRR
ncbi:hypothetical protein MTR_4g052790 [Medicago truncatula]|uniref:Uncharacterized protein n=1 Tax=Medicago truncatula TaxID=3880 RepID=A0A072UKC2_MEDTR|nr:hypothetical protein MTR_4g052790 [Medicago truncatula]